MQRAKINLKLKLIGWWMNVAWFQSKNNRIPGVGQFSKWAINKLNCDKQNSIEFAVFLYFLLLCMIWHYSQNGKIPFKKSISHNLIYVCLSRHDWF